MYSFILYHNLYYTCRLITPKNVCNNDIIPLRVHILACAEGTFATKNGFLVFVKNNYVVIGDSIAKTRGCCEAMRYN